MLRVVGSGQDPNKPGSVAFAGLFGEEFLELAVDAVHFLGFGKLVALFGQIGPDRCVFGVHLKPLFKSGLGVGLDGVGGTFRLAHPAVDAFVGVDDQHVFTFIKTIDRADFDAVGVFALDAIVGDDIGHEAILIAGECEEMAKRMLAKPF